MQRSEPSALQKYSDLARVVVALYSIQVCCCVVCVGEVRMAFDFLEWVDKLNLP